MREYAQYLTSLMLGIALFLTISSFSRADIYQGTDAEGVVHLTNVPLDSSYQLLLRVPHLGIPAPAATKQDVIKPVKNKPDYKNVLSTAAREQNLDKALLRAVITVESAFDPQAVSSDGAVGLMQLMPATAKRYGVKNRYDPLQNVQGGAAYLHDLMQRFHNNLPLVLAAYNAGEHAVSHFGNHIPPYPETRRYVPRVLNLYHQYKLRQQQ